MNTKIKELVEILNHHNYQYYVLDDPPMLSLSKVHSEEELMVWIKNLTKVVGE